VKISLFALISIFLLAFLPVYLPLNIAFSNGQAASLVIGQASFTTNAAGNTSTGLTNPFAAAFDPPWQSLGF